jgi:hypothetical protein
VTRCYLRITLNCGADALVRKENVCLIVDDGLPDTDGWVEPNVISDNDGGNSVE